MTNDVTLPALPKHDHAFQDLEGEQPDIRMWNEQSMRAYALAAVQASRHEPEAPHCDTPDFCKNIRGSCKEVVPSQYRTPSLPSLDAGLRFRPTLERASNTREGYTAEMEQAHDGEWVHISALNRGGKP